jgi:Tfp pilus assembly protein PilN
MIKVNLVRKRTVPTAGAGGKADDLKSKLNLDALRSMGQGGGKTLAPLFFKIGIPAIFAFAANFFYDETLQGIRDEQAKELAAVAEAKEKINKQLQKIKGFESIKMELERNSMVIRAKMDTIENLIRGREFTARSMTSLVQALPRDAWIVELSQVDKSYSIRGGAIEYSMVSDFMSRLGRTIYFKDVALRNSSSDQTQKRINFELTARRD